MSDVEITLRLPEALIERARAVGIRVEDQTPQIIERLEHEIEGRESAHSMSDVFARIDALPDDMKPTLEEIDAAVKQARAEITAQKQTMRTE